MARICIKGHKLRRWTISRQWQPCCRVPVSNGVLVDFQTDSKRALELRSHYVEQIDLLIIDETMPG